MAGLDCVVTTGVTLDDLIDGLVSKSCHVGKSLCLLAGLRKTIGLSLCWELIARFRVI